MMRFLALILFISIPVTALGQQQQKDTTSFYKDLYRYSKERKLLI